MCPPVSPHKGASIVKFPAHHACFLVWKRRCADVRAGIQAPPLRILLERIARGCSPLRFRLGRLRVGRLISFGVNCAWTEFCLYGIAWKNMMEMGRGGAYVPARVAPRGRTSIIHSPRTMCVFLVWKRRYADVRAGTQAPPYGFVWMDCVWVVDFVWADCA